MHTSIDIEFFLNRHPIAILKENSQLKSQKILDILSLDCFNEKNIFVPKRAKHNNISTNISSNMRQKEKTLSYKDKLLREVIGNINKINTSNFNNIYTKISRIIDMNNISEITNIILEYASGQHFGYMSQLMDLLNMIPEQFYEIKQETIIDFLKKSLESFDQTLDHLNNLDHENYDDFCKLLKEKKFLYQKWTLLYSLFDKNHIDFYPEKMFEKLSYNLIKFQTNKILQTHMFEMMFVFFKNFKNEYMHLYLMFLEIIDKIDPPTTKGKFICSDIITLK